jgi:hypothetical protein
MSDIGAKVLCGRIVHLRQAKVEATSQQEHLSYEP